MTFSPDNCYNSYLFGRFAIYAIIETGGKQYRVTPGQTLKVERLGVAQGGTVELERVLLIADGEKTIVGEPTIEGAKVIATAGEEGKGEKIIVFKYKPKVRYRRKLGHRQSYTTLKINQIIEPGAVQGEPKKRTRRRKKEEIADGT